MLSKESHFVEYLECPKCHISGKRKTLAMYSDGHGYCYYCSNYTHGNRTLSISDRKSENDDLTIKLPYDALNDIPVKPLIWLNSYEITRQEVQKYGIMYSSSKDFLIFPYYGDDKQLVAWQGRDFKPSPPTKWYSKGPLEDVFFITGSKSNKIVIVEDVVSAIKVGRTCQAMPIFGTNCKSRRLAALKILGITEVVFWFDPDARYKAFISSQEAKNYGLTARIVLSEKDPKEHTDAEIKDYLNG